MFILLLPGVGAQSDTPAPLELVVTSAHPVRYSTNAGPQVQHDVYANWTRSTADPGNWTYNVCSTIIPSCQVVTPDTIPNRATYRWVSFRLTGSFPLQDFGELWSFNVSANRTTFSGLATSNVSVNVVSVGEHNQTGNLSLTAPRVVSVQVAQIPTTTSEGRTMYTWQHSPDDFNNTTTGDFDYWVFKQFVQPNGAPPPCSRLDTFLHRCDPGSPSTTFGLWEKSPSGSGLNGYRFLNVTYAGTSPFYLALDVTAVDNATGLWGTQSCQTVVDAARLLDTQRCGIFIDTSTPDVPVQNAPVFPGLNVTQLSVVSGVSLTNAGYAMGAFLVLGLAIAGFLIAGKAGGGIAGALGAALGYSFNLLEAWAIVSIFTMAVVLVVLGVMGGGRKR